MDTMTNVHALTTLSLDSFVNLRSFLGERDERTIALNTRARRISDSAIAIRFHSTDVLTFHSDGRIVLNSGGWQTYTTKQRLNSFLPNRFGVNAKSRTWFVWDRHTGTSVEFHDGIVVTA